MPASYILTWNPSLWNWKDYDSAITQVAGGETYEIDWSSGNTKKIKHDDPGRQRLVDIAAILASGILRLRERDSLPQSQQAGNPAESSADRLELFGQNVLTVVYGD